MGLTPNYSLPTFGQDDVPTWLGSWNDAMLKIDTAIKEAGGTLTPTFLKINFSNTPAVQRSFIEGPIDGRNIHINALGEVQLEAGGGGTIRFTIPSNASMVISTPEGLDQLELTGDNTTFTINSFSDIIELISNQLNIDTTNIKIGTNNKYLSFNCDSGALYLPDAVSPSQVIQFLFENGNLNLGRGDISTPGGTVKIGGVGTPTRENDAANKEYVDVTTSGLPIGAVSALTYPVISQPSGQYVDVWYNRQGLKFFYDANWSSGFQVSSGVVLFSTTLATKFTSGGSVPAGVMAMAKLASGTWQPIRLVLTINYSTTQNATTVVFTTVNSTPDIRELMIDSYIPFKKQINA